MYFRTLCLATVFGLGLGSAMAQDSTKYQQWPGADAGSGDVETLVQDLEKLIDQAETDRAADPQFLEDLRGVLADYQNPWSERLLYDDFRDGNYTGNPKWTVSSGAFKVDTKGNNIGLRSTIVAAGTTTQSSGNVATDILGALLSSQNTQQSTSSDAFAAIYTPVKVSNAFATRIEFVSAERRGRIDIGPYQGPSGSVAYRVAYLPGQSKDSLRLIRITSKGAVAIGTYKGALNLEDGRRHVIEWTRDRNGAMSVLVDGQELITATDRTITKPFDGFMLINSGGTYYVRSITLDGSKT
jgi:hypothetical protein